MGKAGMDAPAILATLTATPARVFGTATHTGQVAPGFDADPVVLVADPVRNLANYPRVRYTVRGGRIICDGEEHSDRE